jgi:GntR family transcriptional repressor for pyruvate dehydrogenase complex
MAAEKTKIGYRAKDSQKTTDFQLPAQIQPVRLADVIAQRLQTMILEGALKPGEKLIAERELALALGVSRPSLREALAQLEHKNLLVTTKAGTVVARFLDSHIEPLAELLREHERGAEDYLEFRLTMEVKATALAAQRATPVEREAIGACLAAMREAHDKDDPDAESRLDARLHGLIYEASHNVVMLHLMAALSDLLEDNVFYNRNQLFTRPGVRDKLLEHHLAIGEAVMAGNGAAAEAAAAGHIVFARDVIAELRQEELRQATALRRIERTDIVQAGKAG